MVSAETDWNAVTGCSHCGESYRGNLRAQKGIPMLPSTMLLTFGGITIMLITQVGLAPAGGASNKESEVRRVQAEPTRTGKERLGGKASDEQRMDNCKVPPDLRGPTPRPDDCDSEASTLSGSGRSR